MQARLFQHRQTQALSARFDLTPLIDAVFNLLLFFMLTSSFILMPGIRINLPKAVTSEIIHEKSLVVTITEEDFIILNENAVTMEDLAIQLEKGAKENILSIVLGILGLVYVAALVKTFFSGNSQNMALAVDLVKTLTGFFIGVVTALVA